MHKLDFRKYLGHAGEIVSVIVVTSGEGCVLFTLDEVDQGVRDELTFCLSDEPGTRHILRLDMVGDEGEICAVAVQNVDESEDISNIAIVDPYPTRRAEWEFTVGADHAIALTKELSNGLLVADAANRKRRPARRSVGGGKVKEIQPFVVYRRPATPISPPLPSERDFQARSQTRPTKTREKAAR